MSRSALFASPALPIRVASFDDPISRGQSEKIREQLQELVGEPAPTGVSLGPLGELPADHERLFEKLLTADADVGVCPARILPARLPGGVVAAAVRRDRGASYWCVSRQRPVLSLLPTGSKVVACGAVVRAQILHRFPWLWVELAPPGEEIVVGLRHGIWDAGCVPAEVLDFGPAAELQREPLALDQILPPVGHGLATILVRGGSTPLLSAVRRLNDPVAESSWKAERSFVLQSSALPDGVATARAALVGERLEITGLIAGTNGEWLVMDSGSGPARWGEAVAQDVAEACMGLARARGALVLAPLKGELLR